MSKSPEKGTWGYGDVPPGRQRSSANPALTHPPSTSTRCLTMSVSTWGDPTKTEMTCKKSKNKSLLSPGS